MNLELEKIDPKNFKNSKFYIYYCQKLDNGNIEFIKTEGTNDFNFVINFIIENDMMNNNDFFVFEENDETKQKYIYDMENIKKYIINLYRTNG